MMADKTKPLTDSVRRDSPGADASAVRQKFSHGRTRQVMVEGKRPRGGSSSDATPLPQPPVQHAQPARGEQQQQDHLVDKLTDEVLAEFEEANLADAYQDMARARGKLAGGAGTASEGRGWRDQVAEAEAHISSGERHQKLELVGKVLLPAFRKDDTRAAEAMQRVEREDREAEAQRMNAKGNRSPATADRTVTLTRDRPEVWLIANARRHDPTHGGLSKGGGLERIGKDWYGWARHRIVVAGLGVRRTVAVKVGFYSIWERVMGVDITGDGEMLLPLRSTHVRLELVDRSVGAAEVTVDRPWHPPANPDDPDDVVIVPSGWSKRQNRSATKLPSRKR